MIQTVIKRMLLLSGCSVTVIILLSYEFSHRNLSPRGLGIALLIVCAAIGTAAAFLIKKSAKEFAVPPGTSVNAVTRKQLLWQIRMAKIRIAIMGVALVLGLTQSRDFPLLALLIGLVLNLLITAQSVQTVVRVKKILGSFPTSPIGEL
ncbi:MAG: hypothetical protein JWN74_3639 [Acidobacteriaceae bacterium]|jgi:hypothetical protein|nr:hypothetical protein [Acidobacteriaceae bacterium]